MKKEKRNPNQQPINRDQLITVGDLHDFRTVLLVDLTNLLKGQNGNAVPQWLRSSETRKMLGVSTGTLQNMRINRSLTFSKVGGIVYYKYEDVVKMLENNSTKSHE